VTVAADNAAAIAAYERAGFRRATRTEVHRGRMSEVLVWS
jgi:RimJ/RimL family protein N-acetyltransferase